MKTSRFTRIAAISVVSVGLLSGCTGGNDADDKKAPVVSNAPSNQSAPADNAAVDTAPTTPIIAEVSKADVEKVVFADGFDSPEYYQILLSAAEGAQQQVIFQELSETKDVKVCDKLSSQAAVNNCATNFYFTDAAQKKDPKICDKITDEASKNSCSDSVTLQLAREKGDVKICDGLQQEEMKANCSNSVHFEAARKSGDAAQCDKLTDENFADMCKNEVKLIAEEQKRQEEYQAQQAAEQKKQAEAQAAAQKQADAQAEIVATPAPTPVEEAPAQ